jgi:hypothetical protein
MLAGQLERGNALNRQRLAQKIVNLSQVLCHFYLKPTTIDAHYRLGMVI